MLKKLDSDIEYLKGGLYPETLAEWYKIIIMQTKELAPSWLHDKIQVYQDPVLPMRFKLDISKRALKYFMIAVNANIDDMPYSTKLYFLKVQETIETELDKSFI